MSASEPGPYIGRFAPSPTGPLHFGSLLTAVASYLQAHVNGGIWLLRIEDIDPPREQPGASVAILAALENYGFEWDGPASFQSSSRRVHDAAVQSLVRNNQAYRCSCSRRDLASVQRGPLGVIYPGTCRAGCDATEFAIRVRTNDEPVFFVDGLQGRQSQCLETESGDFVILRRDGLIAYQLAVVADDHQQNVTEVVRGIDLMDSTPRQIWLQDLMGYPTPNYLHIPVATHSGGQKLSKNTGAAGIPLKNGGTTLVAALGALGQQPPAELENATLADIWGWATHHWCIDKLQGRTQIRVDANSVAAGQNR